MIKVIHVSLVYISIGGFILRGIWLLNSSSLFTHKLTKILPHIIDSLLLVSGVILAVRIGANPFTTPWLAAKLILLLGYIALGIVAFKLAKGLLSRATAWIAAMITFGYMMSIAVTKSFSPLAFFL